MSQTIKPTDGQINKRIAEFMGRPKCDEEYYVSMCVHCDEYNVNYTESLDSLIPLVERLDFDLGAYLSIDFLKEKYPARALALAIYEVLEND